jgi:GH15 family glucan-1,4-alpha-glucosidase
MDLCLRTNYGAVPPWMEPSDGGFVAFAGADRFAFKSTVQISWNDRGASSEFMIEAGQDLALTLSHSSAAGALPASPDAQAALCETRNFWHAWIERFDKATDWPDAVKRSLITLKALIYAPTGALVAAATTSLPETPGGELNWDYRFSWIRDATFTLGALLNAGLHEEATAWRDWILRTVGSVPGEMRIMYRVDGGRHIPEWEIDWLDGFKHARPVRVGNAASTQHQADIYGELIDALHLASRAGIERTDHSIAIEAKLLEHIEKSWQEPGSGLWESRGTPRHYVYSRAMAWVGVDRFLSAQETRDFVGPELVALYAALRDTIHADICPEGFHPGLGRFVEYYGGITIDASLLMLPLVNFLPIDDPRITATIAAIERELSEDGMVRRKPTKGQNQQGSFIACTFWLADCQHLQGRHTDARRTVERVLAVRNDVGLLSEEYNVPAKHLAGNFPQALSHLALVTSALGLCGPVLQRGGG